jgi:hypothetical protein
MFWTQTKKLTVLEIRSTANISHREYVHLVGDPLEEVEHLQWIKVFVHRLVDVRAKLFLGFDGRGKGLLPRLHLCCRLFCTKLVVDDLQCPSFFDGAICRGTVGTVYNLTRCSIHGFEKRLSLNIFKIGAAEPFEVQSPLWLLQQYSGTCLKEVGDETTCYR